MNGVVSLGTYISPVPDRRNVDLADRGLDNQLHLIHGYGPRVIEVLACQVLSLPS